MKFRTLPVKRQPLQKGFLKRLSAVTKNTRRQRVSAAAGAEAETEDSSSKISRALTIIFLFHILAIALYFVHQRFLEGKTDPVAAAAAEGGAPAALMTPIAEVEAPARNPVRLLSSGERIYTVVAGDNYNRIAAAHEVNEEELRELNDHRDIRAGVTVKLPPKRIIAADPPELAEIRENAVPDRDRGLVEAIPVDAPRAIPVGAASAASASGGSGERYVVKAGDSVWGIANRFKVDQDALMKANGVTDPRRLRVGTTLVIPR